MRWLALLLSIVSFLQTGILCKAEDQEKSLQFSHLRSEDGLSQNAVYAIEQDEYGFIWFGTYDGLDRWDGHRFKRYRHDPFDKNTLISNTIQYLHFDYSGDLWIGTSRGICKLDAVTDKVKRFPLDGEDFNVYGLYEDFSGTIWTWSRDKLFFKHPRDESFTMFFPNQGRSFPDGFAMLSSMAQLDEDRILFASLKHGLFEYNPSTDSLTLHRVVTKYHPNGLLDISKLFMDGNNNLWVCTWNSGILVLDPETFAIRSHYADGESGSRLYYSRIVDADIDDAGNIFFAARNRGLLCYSANTKEIQLFTNDPDNPLSIAGVDVVSVMIDDTGTLWTSTAGMGVSFHSPMVTYFHQSSDLKDKYIYAFSESDDDSLWVGGYQTGLLHTDRNGNIRERIDYARVNEGPLSIRSLFRDSRGDLWVGGAHYGLLFLDKENRKLIPYTGVQEIWDIAEDDEGRIWCATNIEGVLVYSPQTKRAVEMLLDWSELGVAPRIQSNVTILQGPDGLIWIGTTEGLIGFEFQNNRCIVKKYYTYDSDNPQGLRGNFIQDLYLKDDRYLFIGSRSGLSIFDLENETFESFSTEDGLPNEVIYAIVEGEDGIIWLTSNRGISSFNFQDKSFSNYFLNSGLQSWEFNTHAALKAKNGRLYFGGVQGINYLTPSVFERSYQTASAFFSSFKASGVEVGSRKYINSNPTIEFTHNQNDISFQFAINNVHAPDLNSYSYIVEGADDDWHEVGPGYTPIYHNLDPGTYTVRIKGCNDHGTWSTNERIVTIRVNPPFYNTALFRYVVALLILAAVTALFLWRNSLLRKQAEKLEEQLEIRTRDIVEKNEQLQRNTEDLRNKQLELERVNRDLESFGYTVSHDLQSPINTIRSFSQLLIEDFDVKGDSAAADYLNRISRNLEKMEKLIKDLLQYSRSGRRELNRVETNLTTLARVILQDLGVEFDLSRYEIAIQENLLVEADENLIQIALQNLLHNAIKYSSLTEKPKVEFGFDRQTQAYFVRDNGAGFAAEKKDLVFVVFERLHSQKEFAGNGIGLSTVKRIINRHKGEIWAESIEGQGSTFWFTILPQ